jgi:hypothetical protein
MKGILTNITYKKRGRSRIKSQTKRESHKMSFERMEVTVVPDSKVPISSAALGSRACTGEGCSALKFS